MSEHSEDSFGRAEPGGHQWRERGERSWRGHRRDAAGGSARRAGGSRRFGAGRARASGSREEQGSWSAPRGAARDHREHAGLEPEFGSHEGRSAHDEHGRWRREHSERGAEGQAYGRSGAGRRGVAGRAGEGRGREASGGDRRRQVGSRRYGTDGERAGAREQWRGRRSEARSGRERPGAREARARREGRDAPRQEPAIPAGVNTQDLDPDALRELRVLPDSLRDVVAGHLAAAGELIDLDPDEAYRHAQAAVRRASRLDAVREAAALTAYASGHYEEALREVRAVRRMRGDDSLRAVEADCERGLGHPDKAVEIVEATDTGSMALADQVELVLVASGARADLGQPEVGLVLVQDALGALPKGADAELRRRLMSVEVDRLRELGRDEEADGVQADMPPEEDEAEIVDVGTFMDADVDGRPSDLKGTDVPLHAAYDAALVDLDGVCYRGTDPVAHAAEAIGAAQSAGMKIEYITNNASRTPADIAAQLRSLGFSLDPAQITTSAIDAVRLLAQSLPQGASVLAIGGAGLREAVAEQRLATVDSADAHPAAVVLGWDRTIGWEQLSEVAYAVQGGARFYVTNLDSTLPTERGFAVGNGSLAKAVENATGVAPIAAGKPGAGVYRRVVGALGAHAPLGVGDRLNTDIAGARAAGLDSLHVLTGVDSARAVVESKPSEHPSYLALDLRALGQAQPVPKHHADGTWTCGVSQVARIGEDGRPELDAVALDAPSTLTLDSYRALVAAAWDVARSGRDVRCPELTVVANDDPAGVVSKTPRATSDDGGAHGEAGED